MRISESPSRDYGYRRSGLYRKPSVPYVPRPGSPRSSRSSEPLQDEVIAVDVAPVQDTFTSVLKTEMLSAPPGLEMPPSPQKKPVIATQWSSSVRAQSFDLLPAAKALSQAHVAQAITDPVTPEPTEPTQESVASETEFASAVYAAPASFAGTANPISQVTQSFDSLASDIVRISKNVSSRFHRLLSKLLKRNTVLYSMAAIIFLVGIGVSVQSFLINKQAESQVQALTGSDDEKQDDQNQAALPSEKPLGSKDSTASYVVSPDAPRIISIPSIGVEARVLAVGVSATNELQTPKNIYDTAWYSGSSKPGMPGAQFINGHVSGPTKPGVFKNLKQLKAGDKIKIERGDGQVFSYSITGVETLPVEQIDMTKLLVSSESDKPGLNLITCGGKFNTRTNHFEDRTVVYAVQN